MLQSSEIALRSLNGADFIPPYEGDLPAVQVLRQLTRRHVTRLATQDPQIETEHLTMDSEAIGPSAEGPDVSIVRVWNSQQPVSRDLHPEILKIAGIVSPHFVEGSPRNGVVKATKKQLKTIPFFREWRATNGLDPESRDPGSSWYLDLAHLRLSARSVVLCRRCELMRKVFVNEACFTSERPKKAVRQVVRETGSRFEFSFPKLFRVVGCNLDKFYEPLRRYCVLSEVVARPHIAQEMIGRPPMIASFRKEERYGEGDEPFPDRWPFQKHGRPFSLYLEECQPTTGIRQRCWLKTANQVARAVEVVKEQRTKGVQYVFQHYDADYIVACLPLDARNELAQTTRDFQEKIRKDFDPDFGTPEFQEILSSGKASIPVTNGTGREQKKPSTDGAQSNVGPDGGNSTPEIEPLASHSASEVEPHATNFSIQIARDELVNGLEKISRLMIENCQAAADLNLPIFPVAYLDKKVWAGFFRRRLETLISRRALKKQSVRDHSLTEARDPVLIRMISKIRGRSARSLDWNLILQCLGGEEDPAGRLQRLMAAMPRDKKYEDHQIARLCAILRSRQEQEAAKAQIDKYLCDSVTSRAASEESYGRFSKLRVGLSPDIKVTRKLLDAHDEAWDTRIRLSVQRCCRALGLGSVIPKSFPEKAQTLLQRLIDIAELVVEEMAIKDTVRENWVKLLDLLAKAELVSASLKAGEFPPRQLWELIKHPQPCLCDDSNGTVWRILRAIRPNASGELEQFAENLRNDAAREISAQFWVLVGLFQNRDDVRGARGAQIVSGIEGKIVWPGWRHIPTLAGRICHELNHENFSDTAFAADLLASTGASFSKEDIKEARDCFQLLRKWSESEERHLLARKKYFASSKRISRATKDLDFPVEPLIRYMIGDKTRPADVC